MDKIEELLNRGVDKIYPSKEELGKVLRSGKKLRLYQGFDPTGSQLHIGHMVGLRKLRQWQELGHEVIFLIGDFTATIGDPTDKESARVPLAREEVLKNAETYKEQASRIVSFDGKNPVEIKFNSEWLSKIKSPELMKISEYFTQQQFIERDMFQNRMKRGRPIRISELLYPLLQAYDSVAMKVDLELGGTDQTFNMLMGRNLVKAMQGREKFVMTTPLLTDSQGQKIGKTEGNAIGLTDKPSDLYARIMALGDDVIVKGFEYLTDLPMDEVDQISKDLKGGKNPISYKKKLAFEIVKQLNSHEDAHKAQQDFEKRAQGELPHEISVHSVAYGGGHISWIDTLIQLGLASSKSDAKRKIQQRGVKVDDVTLTEPSSIIERGEKIIRVGNSDPIRLVIK